MSNHSERDAVMKKILEVCDKLKGGQSKWKALGMLHVWRQKCLDIARYAIGPATRDTLIDNERAVLLSQLELLLARQEGGLDR